MPTLSTENRFWAKVDKTDSCWLWTGAKRSNGYGSFVWHEGDQRVNSRSHRYSWKLHYGEIPEGMYVCHHCDTPACVRPDHLFLGTNQDNMDDMMAKGRRGTARLSPDLVRQIRNEARNGAIHRAIARRFRVARSTVSQICRGETWRHVGNDVPDDIGDWLPYFKTSLFDSKESTTTRVRGR